MGAPDNFELISDTLSEIKHSIVDSWEHKVRSNIVSAQHQPTPALVDHLPSIIESLIDVLSHDGEADDGKKEILTNINRVHGEQRATQTNYSLEEILKEYSFLRETIIDQLYPLVRPELNSAKIIHQFIDHCVHSTVLEFERVQNEKINQQKLHLELEKQLRQRFVAALTHDLRTPLGAAMMSAEMIFRRSETTSFQQKYLGKINHNLVRMENMIQDFLDVTLIKSGHPAPIKFSEFHLNSLIEETIEDLTTIHGPRFNFIPEADLTVFLGKRSMRRILENLASNAIKYGDQTGMVTIKLTQLQDDFQVSVHNCGNPIPAEDIDFLFGHFVRTKTAKESGKKGWGLGLPLVKGLVDAHHGSVEVTSNAESGTTFTVRMPQRVVISSDKH